MGNKYVAVFDKDNNPIWVGLIKECTKEIMVQSKFYIFFGDKEIIELKDKIVDRSWR